MLSSPGLLTVCDEPAQISDEEVAAASAEFPGLRDIVLCSLPDTLLQPLLGRLNVDGSHFISQQPNSAKQWLWSADPALRSVVAKEALQWHRGMLSQVNGRILQLSDLYVQ
jgi:leucine-rich repeat-containing protein 49